MPGPLASEAEAIRRRTVTYTMQQARYDIAAAHRLGARMGLNEGFNGGHFTLMAPGRHDLVLTIANGTHWAEVRPDNVIAVDLDGNTVEGAGHIERSAFHIHSALHRARPDLRCFMHAHSPYATALSMLEDNRLKTYAQQALRFYTKCAYYDHYGALAHSGDEGERMAAVLGPSRSIVFLGQHGVITGGPTVGRAFHDLYYLERACMNQVMAVSMNRPLREVPDEMAIKAEQQYDSQRDEAELHFASLKRVLAAEVAAFAHAPISVAEAAE